MNDKNSVLLIYPKIGYHENYKFSWMPFSLLALASTLLEAEFNPVIIDQNRCSFDEIIKQVEEYIHDAIFVGLSVMTGGGQIEHALRIADHIRKIAPTIPLVWGGPHVSAMPKQSALHRLVDIAVIGQGEVTVLELAKLLRNGQPIESVDGICAKSSSSSIFCTKARKLTQKGMLPPYPWHIIDLEPYIQNDTTINTRTLGYISSQGCPYRCKFCYEYGTYNAWWSGFDASRILRDLINLKSLYDINGVKFYDADFFVRPTRVEAFCKGILNGKADLKWAGSANPHDILRLQRLKPHILRLVRDTNCTRILMGLESGSNRTLELINKHISVKELKHVVEIMTSYDFMGSFTFIVGFPGESIEDLNMTLELVEFVHKSSDKHETRLHIFAPYPGTPLYDLSIRYGFIPPKRLEEWSNYNYYMPQTPWTDKRIVDIVKKYTKLH